MGYNPFQFTGVDLDSATGFYRMTQRFYGPASGRFSQLDRLTRSILDVNRYAYAGCNPANFVDPTGLLTECQEAIGAHVFTTMGAVAALLSIPATAGLSLVALTGLSGLGFVLLSGENIGDECRNR